MIQPRKLDISTKIHNNKSYLYKINDNIDNTTLDSINNIYGNLIYKDNQPYLIVNEYIHNDKMCSIHKYAKLYMIIDNKMGEDFGIFSNLGSIY